MAGTTRQPSRPTGVFNDRAKRPTEARFNVTLGPAHTALDLMLTALRATEPALAWEWQYSARPGWHRICLLHQRRLFYLLPQAGGFRLSLIVGAKALADLLAGPHTAAVKRRLKSARPYPEGTAFIFTSADFDAPVALAFLEAKLAH